MKKSMLYVCLLLVAVLSCNGCTRKYVVKEGAAPGVRIRDPQAPQTQIRWNSVVIIDDSLQDWQGSPKEKKGKIAVENTNARRTPTGTVEVWAVLRNRTDYPLQIEGRTHFFDKNYAPVEGPTAWQRVYLSPNSVAVYREFSTNVMDIGYYYVEIREGR